MNNGDKWFFGFITIWVILCAGEPDLLDAITKRVAQECSVEVSTGAVEMTRDEFIEELLKYPPDAEVIAESHQEGCASGWEGKAIVWYRASYNEIFIGAEE